MSARISGLTEARDRVLDAVASLGTSWEMLLRLPQTPRAPYATLRPRTAAPGTLPTNGAVLDALAARGRDPFVAQANDRARIASDAMRDTRSLSGAALALSIANRFRAFAVERMRGGAMPSISAEWSRRKSRLGYPSSPGVASGQLSRALGSAQILVRKVR